MSTILRYVRHLRKLNHVGWRVALQHPHLEVTGAKLVNQLPNLSRSYATNTAAKWKSLQFEAFQHFESQLKKTGRVFATEIEHWLKETNSQKNTSSLNALLLIRSCGKPLFDTGSEKSIQLLEKVLQTLEKMQIRMDVSHYNAILNVYLEKDYEFSPEEFLAMMEKKKIEPNRITFQRLISGYCKKGDITGATQVLTEMKNRGMPLCEDIFSSLIKGHSVANDMGSVTNTLEMMKNAGIQPSADIYVTLLCIHAKRGNMEAIKETIEQMEKEDLSLLETHYLDVIGVLATNGFLAEAEELAKKLSSGVRYDTDICRLLIKLTHEGQLEFALKLFKYTTKLINRQMTRSSLFIKAMVYNKSSPEDIIRVCEFMRKEFQINHGYSSAIYHALVGNTDLAVTEKLLQAWAKTGAQIQEHFFFPLLISQGKAGNKGNIFRILKFMKEDFNISPSIETLRDYVVRLFPGSLEDIIEMAKSLDIPMNDIMMAIIERLTIERKLRDASSLISYYPATYSKEFFLQRLVSSLLPWENSKPFVIILRHLSDTSEPANPDQVPISLVDKAITEVMKFVPSDRTSVMKNLLNEMVASGLTISVEVGNQLKTFLGSNTTPEINASIDKLTSGELTVVPMATYNSQTPVKGKSLMFNKQTRDLGRKFNKLIEQQDVDLDDFLEVLRKMEATGQLSAWVITQAVYLFCKKNQLELAEEYVKKFYTIFPEFTLNVKTTLKLALVLVNNNRFEDAYKFLAKLPEKQNVEQDTLIKALLNTVANTKNSEHMYQVFELLKQKKYIQPNIFSLGPIIKVHVLNNDIPKAMEAFERACVEYKCTPYKNKLSIKLIEAEDANNLQKLTDLVTELHGESSALTDLAFTFMECGKIRQARKIFETPGLQVFNSKITTAIDHFKKFCPQCLEQMVSTTKDVSRMDRGLMYRELLEVYIQNNDWQRGLALWTEMQDDYVQPTNSFLKKLSELLKKNNQNVPFVYDNDPVAKNPTERKVITLTAQAKPVRIGPFENAINEKNYDKAEKLISESASYIEAIGKYTRLINVAIQDDQLYFALKAAKAMITKYSYIETSTFSELVIKLAESNCVEEIEELGNLMSPNLKSSIKYRKSLSKAMIRAKGLRNFINTFEAKMLESHWKVEEINKDIHFGELVHGLLKDESCLQEFTTWVEKLAMKGNSRGKQALWCYYFIKGDHDKAEVLWNNVVSQQFSPLVRPILEYGIDNKNAAILERLDEQLKKHPKLAFNTTQLLKSKLIECYNSLEQYDDALKILNNIIECFRPNSLKNQVVLDLKNGLQSIGKYFPYEIKFKTVRRKKPNPNSEFEDDNIRSAENISI